MQKAYQFRIYPTKAQKTILKNQFETCRRLYNYMLALRKDSYEKEGKSVSYSETSRILTERKKTDPYLQKVHSQVLQNVLWRVDLAYKAFFRRVKTGEEPGYPRFKSKWRYDSITYPQSGFSLNEDSISASKIGTIRAVLHREVEGKIKTMTIRKARTQKWYVSFSVEYDPHYTERVKHESVGIDLGILSFMTFSTGEKIDNPRFFVTEEKELTRVQRNLSNAPLKSPERDKRRLIVSRVHERIANKRSDFIHKTSRFLVNNYHRIVFEDLNVKKMLSSSYLSKSIADVAWRSMINCTVSKAEEAGSQVVVVDPRNTSKQCSRCGCMVDKKLADRIHRCPDCGLTMDRDQNAAINILRLGLQSQPGLPARSSVVYGGE